MYDYTVIIMCIYRKCILNYCIKSFITYRYFHFDAKIALIEYKMHIGIFLY